MSKGISIIGPGIMGEAIVAGLLRNQLRQANLVTAAGPLAERNRKLKTTYGIHVTTDNIKAVRQAEAVILAVKPQQLDAVFNVLAGKLHPDPLVISIIAGASIAKIQAGLQHQAVVRSMPNAAARIGESITVWCASNAVTADQFQLAREVLRAIGQEIFVEDEKYLDMSTAVSGTGPAYAFLFMEAMIDAGVHLGFPRRISEELVVQTLKGAVAYYLEKHEHPAALRNDITSPAGTSAAALYYLEKAGFRTAISRAVWAAYERSRELGAGKSQSDPEKN